MDDNQLPRTLTDEEMQEEELDSKEQDAPTGKSSDEPKNPKPDEEEEDEQEISRDPLDPEEQEEEEERPVSPRESKRIKQLLDKMSQKDQERQQPRRGQPDAPKNDRQIIPEGEYDTEQINNMAQEYGKKLYEMGLSQAQASNIANMFATRLEIDAPKVGEKYRFLADEPDNQEFNPGVAGFINRMYLNAVGYDPTTGVVENQDLRYPEFIEGFMEAVELVAAGRTAETTKNVKRRAAQTGLRPGGVSKSAYQGEDPRRMSDDQLDKMIAEGLGI